MAVKQYIGARYVPVFVGEWEDKEYEPLTVVMYKGASYVSKRNVPSGTDEPDKATEYWILAADYDAQVVQYRKEVLQFDSRIADNTEKILAEETRATTKETALENSISAEETRATAKETALENSISAEETRATTKETALENSISAEETRATAKETELENKNFSQITNLQGKNIVWFGDSHSDPDITLSANGHLPNVVSQSLSMNLFNFAKSGAMFGKGYEQDGFSDNTITMQTETAAAQMTAEEKNNTALVVIYAGYNDIRRFYNSTNYTTDELEEKIKTGLYETLANVKNMFPKANVHLVPFNWGYNYIYHKQNAIIEQTLNLIANNETTHNVSIMENARWWILGIKSYFQDASHPNETGYNALAKYIISGILGGATDAKRAYRYDGTNYLHGSKGELTLTYTNGMCTCYCSWGATVAVSAGTEYAIFDSTRETQPVFRCSVSNYIPLAAPSLKKINGYAQFTASSPEILVVFENDLTANSGMLGSTSYITECAVDWS